MKNRFFKKFFVFFLIIFLAVLSYLFFYFEKTEIAEAGTNDNVSGWAWSENIGWISFNNTSGGGGTDYGVDIDTATGDFSGYAWSENIGWIKFEPSLSITNCQELQNMKDNLTADYILSNDIDCSDTVNWNWDADAGQFMGFEPIGSFSNPFTGSLDGQGYEITNLFINRESEDNVGLFGYIVQAVINNVGLTNVFVYSYLNSVGGLAGYAYDGIITYSYTTGVVISDDNYTGGLAGHFDGNGRIQNSYSTVDVTGISQVGGLVGYLEGDSQILDSYATGSVIGGDKTGGLVGETSGNPGVDMTYTSNSFATGSVSAGSQVGGLIGLHYGDLQNSFATGSVTRDVTSTGGLIGQHVGAINTVYWNNHAGNPDDCIGTDTGSGSCNNSVVNNEPYFYVASNEPMNEWDFISTWQELPFNYPILIESLDFPEPPTPPNYYACLDLPGVGQNCDGVGDYMVSGWARACSVFASGCNGILASDEERGGWDGWLKLRGTNYGVLIDIGSYPYEFEGWTWGGDIIGWISFNCSNQGVCGTSNYRVVVDFNFAPGAPNPTSGTWDYCGGGAPQIALGIKSILNWTYNDPEGDPQESYEIWIDDDSNFTGAKFNHIVSSSSESYVVDLNDDDDSDWLSNLSWGSTYYWKVRTKDSNDQWSVFSDNNSFTMPIHAYPRPDFNYLPLNPVLNELVSFTDNSICYDAIDTELNCKDLGATSYQWDFDYNTGVDDTTIGDTTYTYTSKDFYNVWLEVAYDGLICSRIKTLSVELYLPAPSWREILP